MGRQQPDLLVPDLAAPHEAEACSCNSTCQPSFVTEVAHVLKTGSRPTFLTSHSSVDLDWQNLADEIPDVLYNRSPSSSAARGSPAGGLVAACLVGSLAGDLRVEVAPLLEDQTLAAGHQSTASVKHLRQELHLHVHLAVVVVVTCPEERPMSWQLQRRVQDLQASEMAAAAAGHTPALEAEALEHFDLVRVQVG